MKGASTGSDEGLLPILGIICNIYNVLNFKFVENYNYLIN